MISVIIPAYNSAGTILRALDSVAIQNCVDIEILLSDDKSSDATVTLAEEWGRLHKDIKLLIVPSDRNSGPAGARNRAINEASGDLIAFLDSDDIWVHGKLKAQLSVMSSDKDVSMVCTGRKTFGKADGGLPTGNNTKPELLGANNENESARLSDKIRRIDLREFAFGNAVVTSSVLIRKSALIDTGCFDEHFNGPEDYDLWMRLASSHKMILIEEEYVLYRSTPGSLSMDDRRFLPQVLRVLDKAYAVGSHVQSEKLKVASSEPDSLPPKAYSLGSSSGALSAFPELKGRAIAYQYVVAAWQALERSAYRTALGYLIKSMVYSPFAIRKSDPIRIKIIFRMLTIISSKMKYSLKLLKDIVGLEMVEINLCCSHIPETDVYHRRQVEEFYKDSNSPHNRFRLIKKFRIGVALCRFSPGVRYSVQIESSGIRNKNKAEKLGYQVRKIDINEFLEDVRRIRTSTDERQGGLPDTFYSEVKRVDNPAAQTNVADYPFYGVIKDGRLYAYMNCLISGEACLIEHVLGDEQRLTDGVVPLLLAEGADLIRESYPGVRYYIYGTFFGALAGMRRFKKKFGFIPFRVKWILG